RCVEPFPRAYEGTALADVGGQRPPALLREKRLALRGQRREQAALAREPEDRDDGMVLQVPADGKVIASVDPQRGELLGGADPGEQQQLRGLERSGAEDHLALGRDLLELVAPEHLDPRRTTAVAQDS